MSTPEQPPAEGTPGFGVTPAAQPQSVGEALAAADAAAAAHEEGAPAESVPAAADAPVSPAPAEEASSPQVGADWAETPAQAPQAAPGGSAADRLAQLDKEREALQAEVKRQESDARQGEDACPVCGTHPPGIDQQDAREIWCPHCGAKLRDLPAGW